MRRHIPPQIEIVAVSGHLEVVDDIAEIGITSHPLEPIFDGGGEIREHVQDGGYHECPFPPHRARFCRRYAIQCQTHAIGPDRHKHELQPRRHLENSVSILSLKAVNPPHRAINQNARKDGNDTGRFIGVLNPSVYRVQNVQAYHDRDGPVHHDGRLAILDHGIGTLGWVNNHPQEVGEERLRQKFKEVLSLESLANHIAPPADHRKQRRQHGEINRQRDAKQP